MTSWRHSLVLIMKKAAQQILRFKGFLSPRYTQVPNELFDELMVHLSGAELKVLLYVIRRTFGFEKNCVITARNQSQEKGDEPTTYSLHMLPDTENRQGGIPKIGKGGYRKSVT